MRALSLLAALAALMIAFPLSQPSTAAEEGEFVDSLSAEPFGLGKEYDLSQYPMRTVDGGDAGTLGDFAGKYLYVEVWATW